MKKFTLLFALATIISYSASAQWYTGIAKIKVFPKHERYPQLAELTDHSILRLPSPVFASPKTKLAAFRVPTLTDYNLELAEAAVMKTAQHNMRFREYMDASYNFSDLAKLYIKQDRLSEAKWYLLQSNNISRQQNDDKHTVANLKDLALVKADLGDIIMAQQDLVEARQIAVTHLWADDVADIEKEQKFIALNKTATPKLDLRYASDVIIKDKKTADKKTD